MTAAGDLALPNGHADLLDELKNRVRTARLGEVLGHAVQDDLPELGRLAQDIDPASEKRIHELSEQKAALQLLLDERDEELDAVRRLNTDLTRRLNA